ncbi:hypothetical protein JKF63_04857 [Porcisia hertigi]|uniref:SET domain-containing protein n=1 Tax=Porcisia hertigi TaxID=2761500 RepID=A0A836I4C0_9TRYP|nr:hypothetical protein JKF63_04857 [Porcisia hertigi]
MDSNVKAVSELNTIFDRLGVPCKVCVTSEEGKHVRATKDMEKGFALVEEIPIVSWPAPSLLALSIPFCFHCLRLSRHHLSSAVSDAESPSVTPCSSLTCATGAAAAAALPESWSKCPDCVSYFCSSECQQASARVHRLLCSCLPELRASHSGSGGSGGKGADTVTASESPFPTTNSPAPISAPCAITLEALARGVAWVTHRLSYAIEREQLTHEVLQADYVQQQQQQQQESGHSASVGDMWSTASLNYQLFTQVVTPLNRLIGLPDNATIRNVPLASWIAQLRVLLADVCVEHLLVASGATLSSVQRHPLSFGEEEQQPAALAPVLLWPEALVQVLLSTDTLKTLLGQMVLNAHAVNDYVLPPVESASTGGFDWILKGGGLYSLLSCFNHSCVPNAVVSNVDGTHEIVLKATRPIRADEQVTITYIPLDPGTSTRAERQELLNNYFFTCRCPQCTMEVAEGEGVMSSPITRSSDAA